MGSLGSLLRQTTENINAGAAPSLGSVSSQLVLPYLPAALATDQRVRTAAEVLAADDARSRRDQPEPRPRFEREASPRRARRIAAAERRATSRGSIGGFPPSTAWRCCGSTGQARASARSTTCSSATMTSRAGASAFGPRRRRRGVLSGSNCHRCSPRRRGHASAGSVPHPQAPRPAEPLGHGRHLLARPNRRARARQCGAARVTTITAVAAIAKRGRRGRGARPLPACESLPA